MANTIGDTVWRLKYQKNTIETALRNMLVAEKICDVDRSEGKYIRNPYGTAPTTVLKTISGTYDVSDFTITDDTLDVNYTFISANHVYDWEETLSNFDMFANRTEELAASVAQSIDKFVLNYMCEVCTGAYTTPAGGFTTAANLNVIMSNLISKVSGYSDVYKGLFLVLENTDITGVIQAQATNGFSFADAALNNGFLTSYMGVDIYVVRADTFVDDTLGDYAVTNDNHKVFGVKGVTTYAAPRGIQFEEKEVTGKTGKEVVCFGYIGAKLWYTKLALVVDITLA